MKGLASKESTVTDGVGADESSKSIFSTDQKELAREQTESGFSELSQVL